VVVGDDRLGTGQWQWAVVEVEERERCSNLALGRAS
jgi:hypothetical protein